MFLQWPALTVSEARWAGTSACMPRMLTTVVSHREDSMRRSTSQHVHVQPCHAGSFKIVSRTGRVERSVDAHRGACISLRWSYDGESAEKSQRQPEGGRDGGFGCKNQPEHGYQYCDRSSSTLWNQRWGPPPFAPCFEGLKPSAPQGWSSVEWRCKHVERLL